MAKKTYVNHFSFARFTSKHKPLLLSFTAVEPNITASVGLCCRSTRRRLPLTGSDLRAKNHRSSPLSLFSCSALLLTTGQLPFHLRIRRGFRQTGIRETSGLPVPGSQSPDLCRPPSPVMRSAHLLHYRRRSLILPYIQPESSALRLFLSSASSQTHSRFPSFCRGNCGLPWNLPPVSRSPYSIPSVSASRSFASSLFSDTSAAISELFVLFPAVIISDR